MARPAGWIASEALMPPVPGLDPDFNIVGFMNAVSDGLERQRPINRLLRIAAAIRD